MSSHKTKISLYPIYLLYLLSLAVPMVNTLPLARHRAPNSAPNVIIEFSRAHSSSLYAPHKIEVHSSQHTSYDVAHLERDADHPVLGQNPTTKRGADDVNTSSSGGSSGISYDKTGQATYIPLGSGNPIYLPFGGVYDVWNSASVLDGSVAVTRAMALSVATVLAVYWIL